MELKFFFYFGIFALVFSTIYGVHYTTQVDEAKRDHGSLVEQVGNLVEATRKTQDEIKRKHGIIPYMTAARKVQEEIDELRKKVAAVRGEQDQLHGLFANLVKRVRTEAPGTTIEQIHMQNGTLLKNAKIVRLEGRNLTIAHDGGIANITASELPEELQFRFGFNISLPGLSFSEPEHVNGHKPISEVIIPSSGSNSGSPPPVRMPPSSSSSSDRYKDGDPNLWNQVTKKDLGMVYIPGQGWLRVGAKGPIPKK